MRGLSLSKESWNIESDSEDKREKMRALSLAKECYAMMLDLAPSAPVVERAARFVENIHNQTQISKVQNDKVSIDVTAKESSIRQKKLSSSE
ncbi:MAG: hypothetical protein GEU26_18205 [Nitrososphaeraceae archaeon]|nr:hypothetical protein [Nitrososphaeraceae archaeon]